MINKEQIHHMKKSFDKPASQSSPTSSIENAYTQPSEDINLEPRKMYSIMKEASVTPSTTQDKSKNLDKSMWDLRCNEEFNIPFDVSIYPPKLISELSSKISADNTTLFHCKSNNGSGLISNVQDSKNHISYRRPSSE